MTSLRQGVAVLAGAVGLLAATMAVPASAAASTAGQTAVVADSSCPSGWFCFWDGPNRTGNRGRLSACGSQDLGNWGWRNRIQSTYNNTDDWVWYGDSVTGNGWWDQRQTSYDSVPYPKMADRVFREC